MGDRHVARAMRLKVFMGLDEVNVYGIVRKVLAILKKCCIAHMFLL
jgi:hypothetical protein